MKPFQGEPVPRSRFNQMVTARDNYRRWLDDEREAHTETMARALRAEALLEEMGAPVPIAAPARSTEDGRESAHENVQRSEDQDGSPDEPVRNDEEN